VPSALSDYCARLEAKDKKPRVVTVTGAAYNGAGAGAAWVAVCIGHDFYLGFSGD
jgi:hypothetical protein